jgi:hypothetical protein
VILAGFLHDLIFVPEDGGHVALKCRWTYSKLHGITTQNTDRSADLKSDVVKTVLEAKDQSGGSE